MGGCESASENVQIPQMKVFENKFKVVQRRTFVIPPLNKVDICTSNGKITDYIANNIQVKNTYQIIDVSNNLSDGKFVDNQFKANEKSIGHLASGQVIQWKRPKQFMKGPYKVFEGIIQPMDIKQGKLGDCYLLSSLAALSQYPFAVKRIFQTVQQSSFGVYGVWLFIDGMWRCNVLDDLFPINAGRPIYSRNHQNQLWVMLVEKAYAKVYGSYSSIQSGLTGIALNALTGAPYEYLCKNSKQKPDSQTFWGFIQAHLSKNHLLIGSTENSDKNQYLGLVSSHAYTILDSQQVHISTKKGKKKERILKIQNPWGKYEWKGRWSEYSDVWSEELREQLKFQKADDGLFWINIDDFAQNFGQVCSCMYNKNYINTSLPLKCVKQQENSFKGVFLSTASRTEGYLTVTQKDHRYFPNSGYEYSLIRIIVLQLDKATGTLKKYIGDLMDCDHDATIELTLDSGDYYVIIEVDWKCAHNRDICINFYGQHPIQILEDQASNSKFMTSLDLFNEVVLLHEQFTDKQRVYVYGKDEKIVRKTGSIAGYVYYHYSNKSKTNNYLCQNVCLKESQFIQVQGELDKYQFTAKVYPDEERIVRLKVMKQGNSFYSFSTKIQFYIVQKYTIDRLRELADKKPTKIKTRQIDGKPIDVKVKTYNYSGGIALLYQNKMDKYAYNEQIVFDIDNLELENETLPKNMKLQIELEPQSQRLLSFVVSSPGKQVVFRTKMSFYLNSPEFKF